MNRLPSSQRHKRREHRWKRYEKQLPGHRIQVDVKFIEPLTTSDGGRPKRYYQFTAIDDCTRIRVLRIFDRNTQKSAIQFIDYVLANSKARSTGTSSTAGSATPTSSRERLG